MGRGKGKGSQEVVFTGTLMDDGIDDAVASQMGLTKGGMKMMDDPNRNMDSQRRSDKSLREEEMREFQAAMAKERGPAAKLAQPTSASGVKRKAPTAPVKVRPAQPAAEEPPAAAGTEEQKKPRAEGKGSGQAPSGGAAAKAAAPAEQPAQGLGLGGYDSDDSEEDESDEQA